MGERFYDQTPSSSLYRELSARDYEKAHRRGLEAYDRLSKKYGVGEKRS